jgi:protein-disulfide isomerase
VPDTTVWKVAVGKSPVRGPTDALVTIVEFSDYQCPFCKRAQKTVDEVLRRYDGKVRLVFKHNPLPFHKRAMPAAVFASEARAQKGDKGFWDATTRLFEQSPALEDEDLLDIAQAMKLNTALVKLALSKEKRKAKIEEDADLATELEARGTPAFFINGRKLSGAQPIEKFAALIDEELAKAEELVKKGTRKTAVYAATIKDGRLGAPLDLAQSVPSVSKANPSRGPANAPVTIQIFSDFQCPFCKRVLPTLEAVEKQFRGRVRIVWRNYPLPFHSDARPAAMAAMEAFAQKGNAGFWKMHELIYAGQSAGLDRVTLEGYAKKLGLAPEKFRDALDSGSHEAEIQADEAAAKAAGIRGTPAFVINGYYVSGAQPLSTFKKVVMRALEDKKLGRKPQP